MSPVVTILFAVLRLVLLAIAGFLIFRIPRLRERLLTPFTWTVVNLLLPAYFLAGLPAGWDEAIAAGWQWTIVFFAACFVMMGLQFLIGELLVRRLGSFASGFPRSTVALIGTHNAGYIPLPILAAVAPRAVLVYLFFYFLAYNIFFWTVSLSYLAGEERGRPRFRLNPPLLGIAGGILLALTGAWPAFPPVLKVPLEAAAGSALPLVLVALGGLLATVPPEDLRFRPFFARIAFVKLILWPACFLGIAALLPLGGVPAPIAFGIRFALVLEAAVPPATNLIIAARAYGNREQVHFFGGAIVNTYLAAVVTLPLFLVAAMILFR